MRRAIVFALVLGCGGQAATPPKTTAASTLDLDTEIAALAPTYADPCFAINAWGALDTEAATTAVEQALDRLVKEQESGSDIALLCIERAVALRLAQRTRQKTLDLNGDLSHRVKYIRHAAVMHVIVTRADVDRSRLRALLDDEDDGLRAAAIAAIVRLRDVASAPKLDELMKAPIPPFDMKELDPYSFTNASGAKIINMSQVPLELKKRAATNHSRTALRRAACDGLEELGMPSGSTCSTDKRQRTLAAALTTHHSNRPPDEECSLMRSRLRRGDNAERTLEDFIFDRVKPFVYGVSLPNADMTWHPCPLPTETMAKLRAAEPPLRRRLALILAWDRHLLGMRKTLPQLALPNGFEKLMQAELDETPMSMTFADDFFPKDFVPTEATLARKTFDATLLKRTRRPHPENAAELLYCFQLRVVNKSAKPDMPTVELIDDERFRYGDEARVELARGKTCAQEPRPRLLKAGEAADVWFGFHLPPEAHPIALDIKTSEIENGREVFDAGAIRLVR